MFNPPVNVFVLLTGTVVTLIDDDPTFGPWMTFTTLALDADSNVTPFLVDEFGNPDNLNYDGQLALDVSDTSDTVRAKIVADVQSAYGVPDLTVTFLSDSIGES